jgi:hypothetical protein
MFSHIRLPIFDSSAGIDTARSPGQVRTKNPVVLPLKLYSAMIPHNEQCHTSAIHTLPSEVLYPVPFAPVDTVLCCTSAAVPSLRAAVRRKLAADYVLHRVLLPASGLLATGTIVKSTHACKDLPGLRDAQQGLTIPSSQWHQCKLPFQRMAPLSYCSSTPQ